MRGNDTYYKLLREKFQMQEDTEKLRLTLTQALAPLSFIQGLSLSLSLSHSLSASHPLSLLTRSLCGHSPGERPQREGERQAGRHHPHPGERLHRVCVGVREREGACVRERGCEVGSEGGGERERGRERDPE